MNINLVLAASQTISLPKFYAQWQILLYCASDVLIATLRREF